MAKKEQSGLGALEANINKGLTKHAANAGNIPGLGKGSKATSKKVRTRKLKKPKMG